MKVLFTKKETATLPEYKTEGSAGADVRACIEDMITIEPMGVKLIGTGLYAEIPDGYEIQVRSRSGLSLKEGLFCLNAPGTIDSDYRGEIGVILANFSPVPRTVHHGDRIAQLVLARVERIEPTEDVLSQTERGAGGFGHTGVK